MTAMLFGFSVAVGRTAEFHNQVKIGEPSTARLSIVAIVSTSNDTLIDNRGDLAAVLAVSSTDEVTNSGYSRIVLTASDLAAIEVDDSGDGMLLKLLADPVFSSIGPGDNWTHIVLCYDELGTNVDANMIPMVIFNCIVTPNGGDITLTRNAAGYFEAGPEVGP